MELIQRYDLNEELIGDAHPAYSGNELSKSKEGELVKFEDVRRLVLAAYDKNLYKGNEQYEAGAFDVSHDLMVSLGLVANK